MTTNVLKPLKVLKPEDFRTQVYAALMNDSHCSWLPRVEVVWGQTEVRFPPVNEVVTSHCLGIFDRPDGGEALLITPQFRQGPRTLEPGDYLVAWLSGPPWN